VRRLKLFFCRSEEQLPHERSVLRGDPSVECWDSAHYIAFVVALLVFAAFAVATPMFLFRSIRQSLAKQDEAQGVELSQLSTSAGALRQSVAEDRERETFTAAFHKYDADANGQIDEEELGCILEEKTGIKTSQEEIQALQLEFMGRIQQALTLDEFLELMAEMKKQVIKRGNHQRCVGHPFI
jgi:hypothetical protein